MIMKHFRTYCSSILVLLLVLTTVFYSCKKKNPTLTSTPKTVTVKGIDGNLNKNDNSAILSNDDNVLLTGNDGSKIFLAKTNKSGDEIWYHKYGSNFDWKASGMVETATSDIYVCGRNYNGGILLLKFDQRGSLLWDSTIVINGNEWG